ncbi:hypothetical protein ACSF6V_11325 [Escherichia coli]|uniref:hypothetical protein n=1 Tax=Escherichia coli TaxID=562 RepID=UPI003EE8E5DE
MASSLQPPVPLHDLNIIAVPDSISVALARAMPEQLIMDTKASMVAAFQHWEGGGAAAEDHKDDLQWTATQRAC